MLYYPYPLLVEDRVKGAKEGSEVAECTVRHFYYLCGIRGGLPVEREGSTIYLSRSFYFAWRFAQARKNAQWDDDDNTWIEMVLKVQKAEALLDQLAQRSTPIASLTPPEIACCISVLHDAIKATARVFALRQGKATAKAMA